MSITDDEQDKILRSLGWTRIQGGMLDGYWKHPTDGSAYQDWVTWDDPEILLAMLARLVDGPTVDLRRMTEGGVAGYNAAIWLREGDSVRANYWAPTLPDAIARAYLAVLEATQNKGQA